MTTLTPDLTAAAAAARRLRDDCRTTAALALTPATMRLRSGTLIHSPADIDWATDRSWQARAAELEVGALLREAGIE